MRHPGLKARMVVMGAILFAFYALLVLFFEQYLTLPLVIAGTALFVVVQYVISKKMALWSVDAEDMPEEEYRWIHQEVERLSDDMDVDKPRLMVGQMGVPNAFAVGRKGAGVVVVSETLIDLLDRDELKGVLAHEIAHIRNRDVIMMLIGQSIASMIGITVFWVVAMARRNFLLTIFAWIASTIVQTLVMIFVLAISRYREYAADSDAADVAQGEALGRALLKIDAVGSHPDAPDVGENIGALCIFGGERGLLATLFATHPPIEKRVEKLAPHLLERGFDEQAERMIAG